jgi:hypothetical protein
MLYFTKQVCRPSHDKKGLKDWANPTTLSYNASVVKKITAQLIA